MTNLELFTTWIRNTWRIGLIISYFLAVLVISTILLYDKYSHPQTFIKEEPKPVVQEKVNLLPLEEKIKHLETTISKTNERIETAQVQDQIRRLERRLQAQLEYNKRLCEYIMVITVDKKIVPRQCLPEYRWQREEGQ